MSHRHPLRRSYSCVIIFMATFTIKSKEERAERKGASAERCPVFIKTCPTTAVNTPISQAQCKDSVDLAGDLRPEVLLGCLDDYHVCSSAVQGESRREIYRKRPNFWQSNVQHDSTCVTCLYAPGNLISQTSHHTKLMTGN